MFSIFRINRKGFSNFLDSFFEFENCLHSTSVCFDAKCERSVSCDTNLSSTNQKAPFTLRTWDSGPEKINTYIQNEYTMYQWRSQDFRSRGAQKIRGATSNFFPESIFSDAPPVAKKISVSVPF